MDNAAIERIVSSFNLLAPKGDELVELLLIAAGVFEAQVTRQRFNVGVGLWKTGLKVTFEGFFFVPVKKPQFLVRDYVYRDAVIPHQAETDSAF